MIMDTIASETEDEDNNDDANTPEEELDSIADEEAKLAAASGVQTSTVKNLEAIYDVPVQISAVLGKSNMQVSELLELSRGRVVELDRKVGEAIDIYVNNRLVARGEVVVVEERLGVTMTEIVKSET